jgi:hypothetical protein
VADQAEHLAGGDPQVGRVQGGNVPAGDPVGLVDLLKLDHVTNLVRRMKRNGMGRPGILACDFDSA